MISEIQHWIFN